MTTQAEDELNGLKATNEKHADFTCPSCMDALAFDHLVKVRVKLVH
jgi:hypothetical protein